jgi:hypothetical protein
VVEIERHPFLEKLIITLSPTTHIKLDVDLHARSHHFSFTACCTTQSFFAWWPTWRGLACSLPARWLTLERSVRLARQYDLPAAVPTEIGAVSKLIMSLMALVMWFGRCCREVGVAVCINAARTISSVSGYCFCVGRRHLQRCGWGGFLEHDGSVLGGWAR